MTKIAIIGDNTVTMTLKQYIDEYLNEEVIYVSNIEELKQRCDINLDEINIIEISNQNDLALKLSMTLDNVNSYKKDETISYVTNEKIRNSKKDIKRDNISTKQKIKKYRNN